MRQHRAEVELEARDPAQVPLGRDARVHLAEPARVLARDQHARRAARVQERIVAAHDASTSHAQRAQQRLQRALGGEEVGRRRRRRRPTTPAAAARSSARPRCICSSGQRRRARLGGGQLAAVRAVEVDRALLEEPHVLARRGRRCGAPRSAASRAASCASPTGPRESGLRSLHRGRVETAAGAPISGAWKLQPIASEKPTPTSASPARRRSFCSTRQAAGRAVGGQRRGQLVQPPQPRDLLDQVDLARDVVAPERRDGHVEAVAGVDDAEVEPLEQLGLLAERDLGAEQAA